MGVAILIRWVGAMNKEDVDAVDILCKEVLKYIDRAVKEKTASDRTYKTVIKRVVKNGYVITDQAGQERIVPCGIPNIELRPMQSVYVKEPMGKLNELHICNVIENTNNSTRRNRIRQF
jgi:hypothetical protein